MKSNTVFGHLVHQFAVHPENLATEAVSFILRTSPAASGAFTKFVKQILANCPFDMRFETQQVGLDEAIPDMKGFDDEGNIRVIVENKFWAGLTDNQPVTYIRELPAGVEALVLLVVPAARLQIVWTEIVARCERNEISVRKVQVPTTMMAAGIGEGHYLAATSWGALLDALSTAAGLAAEINSQNDIAQLRGLCRTMEEEAFLPLRSEELMNVDMARRIVNFSDLPFSIVNEAGNQGLIDKKGLRETSNRYGSGSYVRIGKYSAWIGFHAEQWRRFEVSPIWVNFYPEYCPLAEVREILREAMPKHCFDMDSRDYRNYRWITVPISLTAGVEKHRIIEDAVHQIRELRDKLGVRESLPALPNPRQTDTPDTIPEWRPTTSQGEDKAVETILEFGAEGGSITLLGNRDASGQWRFWMQTDETSMNEFLDEDDRVPPGYLVNTSDSASSLPEALALLDKYSWCNLTPLQVHPEFRLAILHQVREKCTPEEVASWGSNPLFRGLEPQGEQPL